MSQKKVKIRARLKDGVTTVKALIEHPMETGLRKDKTSGKTIPAHFIQEVICTLNGQHKASWEMGISIARNPFLQFEIEDAAQGDTLEVSWKDNLGESASGSTTVR